MKINKIREARDCFRESFGKDNKIAKWLSDYIDCRNELCEKCGEYAYNKKIGGCDGCRCDGCRWEEED